MDNEVMENLKKINTMDKLRFSGESIRENNTFYNANQLTQIIVEFRHGLSTKEVFLYANPKLSFLQMRQIRLGLEHGLNDSEISEYLDPKLEYTKMLEIRPKIEKERIKIKRRK